MVVTNAGAGTPATNTEYGQIATASTTVVVAADASSTEAAVRTYFRDIPIMVQIARCESQFRQTNASGTVLRGVVDPRDVGVMQINTHYHGKEAASLGLNLENLNDNMAYARHLYEKQGTQPWSASRACWGSALASRS